MKSEEKLKAFEEAVKAAFHNMRVTTDVKNSRVIIAARMISQYELEGIYSLKAKFNFSMLSLGAENSNVLVYVS